MLFALTTKSMPTRFVWSESKENSLASCRDLTLSIWRGQKAWTSLSLLHTQPRPFADS
jgi:hypothetical protein